MYVFVISMSELILTEGNKNYLVYLLLQPRFKTYVSSESKVHARKRLYNKLPGYD